MHGIQASVVCWSLDGVMVRTMGGLFAPLRWAVTLVAIVAALAVWPVLVLERAFWDAIYRARE